MGRSRWHALAVRVIVDSDGAPPRCGPCGGAEERVPRREAAGGAEERVSRRGRWPVARDEGGWPEAAYVVAVGGRGSRRAHRAIGGRWVAAGRVGMVCAPLTVG